MLPFSSCFCHIFGQNKEFKSKDLRTKRPSNVNPSLNTEDDERSWKERRGEERGETHHNKSPHLIRLLLEDRNKLSRLPQHRTLREEPCASVCLKILNISWFKINEKFIFTLKKLPFKAYSKSSLSTSSHHYPALITITRAAIITTANLSPWQASSPQPHPSPWQPSSPQPHPFKHPGELLSCLLWLKTTLWTSFSLAHYKEFGKLNYLIMPHRISTLPNQILTLPQGFIYIFSGPLKIVILYQWGIKFTTKQGDYLLSSQRRRKEQGWKRKGETKERGGIFRHCFW